MKSTGRSLAQRSEATSHLSGPTAYDRSHGPKIPQTKSQTKRGV